MARPKKNAEVVEEVVTPDEEVATEEPTEELVMVADEEKKAEEVTSADSPVEVTVQSSVKNVKVKVRKDHSCCIGGVWYNLEAGKEINVPSNVKQILASAGLLEVM